MNIEKEQQRRHGRTSVHAILGAMRLLQRLKRLSNRTLESASLTLSHNNIVTSHYIDPISVRLVVNL